VKIHNEELVQYICCCSYALDSWNYSADDFAGFGYCFIGAEESYYILWLNPGELFPESQFGVVIILNATLTRTFLEIPKYGSLMLPNLLLLIEADILLKLPSTNGVTVSSLFPNWHVFAPGISASN